MKYECVDCGVKIWNNSRRERPRCLSCWRKFTKGHPERWAHFKGGRIIGPTGYAWLWCPDHPNRNKHTNRILEHRYIMEQKIGRILKSSEHVHHLNGQKSDNRPDNLVLTNISEHHSKYHHHSPRYCKMCGKKGQTRRGYCMTHYMRWWEKGFPAEGPEPDPKTPVCTICGGKHCAKGLCEVHYRRLTKLLKLEGKTYSHTEFLRMVPHIT